MRLSHFLADVLSLGAVARCAAVPQTSASTSPIQASDLVDTLDKLQTSYFDLPSHSWRGAIDWTSAVLGTHLPATLKTISKHESLDHATREALIDRYFDHMNGFYNTQPILSLFLQANDDILWVVLNWLEMVTFVQDHARRRHANQTVPWHGLQYIPAYAHRARAFWDKAAEGWDETLCGGGMLWQNLNTPAVIPYKNAITNELWVAASAAMYIQFPGDDVGGPLQRQKGDGLERGGSEGSYLFPPHDPKYLNMAIKAYNWLQASGMQNDRGLYIDGFHLTGTVCDAPSKELYTYNQGVLLTGQRNLWQGTGDIKYLEDGYSLIESLILATGWDIRAQQPIPNPRPQGMGRAGVLEDNCDSRGQCRQDETAFKGIFFLHFNSFCQPLPTTGSEAFGFKASTALAQAHAEKCRSYAPWVEHNANAALTTRNPDGLFGMYWNQYSGFAEKNTPENPPRKDDAFEHFSDNIITEAVLTDVEEEEGEEEESEKEEVESLIKISDGETDTFLSGDIDMAKGDVMMDEESNNMELLYQSSINRFFGQPSTNSWDSRSAEIQSGGVSVLRAAVEQSILGAQK